MDRFVSLVRPGVAGVVYRVVHAHRVSASFDQTIRVYKRATLTQTMVIRHHKSPVVSLDVQADMVLSGSRDGAVLLSDITTGECLRAFYGCRSTVTSVKMQNRLVCAGDDAGRLYCWDRMTGHEEAAFHIHQARINQIAFLGSRLYTASHDWSVKEWDLATMTLIRSFDGHKGPVEDMKVTERRIVTCSNDGNVFVWNLEEESAKKPKGKKNYTKFPVLTP